MTESDSRPGTESSVVDARLAEIAARFPDRLSQEQLVEVRKRIEQSVDLARALHSTPLENADEPEIVFAPYSRGRIDDDR